MTNLGTLRKRAVSLQDKEEVLLQQFVQIRQQYGKIYVEILESQSARTSHVGDVSTRLHQKISGLLDGNRLVDITHRKTLRNIINTQQELVDLHQENFDFILDLITRKVAEN